MSNVDLFRSELARLEDELAELRRGREGVPTLGHLVAVRLRRIAELRAQLDDYPGQIVDGDAA
jgi:hypothetical protein